MESSTEAGLTIIYDEETGIITFEWDEDTHPEYNYIKELTSDDFSAMLYQYLEDLDGRPNQDQATDDNPQV